MRTDESHQSGQQAAALETVGSVTLVASNGPTWPEAGIFVVKVGPACSKAVICRWLRPSARGHDVGTDARWATKSLPLVVHPFSGVQLTGVPTRLATRLKNEVSVKHGSDAAGGPRGPRSGRMFNMADPGQRFHVQLAKLARGFADGCVNYANDGNFQGYIYSLNLSTSFNTSSNFLAVLKNETIAGGTANNLAPNYIDGVMFSNQNEFYLYGGMARLTNSSDPPPNNEVLGYEGYQYGAYRNNWGPGWHEENLSANVTRYITNGAGVSAPSENLGFYFSGMRAADWGSFTYDQLNANITADTLISVDMSTMGDASWTNDTLPDQIPGRANAELVWVPVSDSGVLVAIGGVVYPTEFYQNTGLNASQTAESKKISPTFMETVSVYDVKSQQWYLQNTTGETPPQLTQFCSVLASASDGSSHNIYIYGGYNGIELDNNPSDDVYILSLPSFKWVKAYSGTNTHGRSGHQCIKVYPDQMLALGGVRVGATTCLGGGVIVNFNLNSLNFQDSYDPKQWSKYEVPDVVTAQIGGSATGGATTTAPSSWTNNSLAGIFDKKYSKTLTTYWPYNSANSSSSSSTATSDHKGSGFPKWAAAVIGVLCGILVVALLVGAWWFWRRRRRQHRDSLQPTFVKSDGATEADSTEVRHLMYGGGPTSPVPGPRSTSTGMETGANDSSVHDSVLTSVSPRTVESGGDAVYEMHDSSPIELATPYNVASSTPNTSPLSSPIQTPVSPASPESEAAQFARPGHNRTLSTASTVPSIDNVMTGRTSYFQEGFDNKPMPHARHESEISELSVSPEERTQIRGETILEDELYIRNGV
ncbi:uncharacterized protein N7482_008835 [Penicillium canariense]|uniref:Galactose oxidase/kelch, beta-propeller n=1 Tax=Penicillium canariense TaxID=189055 RepID=A0A9W9LJD9_9EURO|nr:uncharacterized protein N7482_008835 [Penicillium canariense]KAJ5157735.1 hypothetical protein N7482_008835 [Penicillium canariense]